MDRAIGLGTGLRRLYATLWRHAAGRRRLVLGFLGLLGLAQAVRLTIPYFFGTAVNALQVSGGRDLPGAAEQMGLMLGACVLAWGLHFPGRLLERFTAIEVRRGFVDALYAKAMALPLRWHEGHHSGQTIQRMNKAGGALFQFAQHQFVYLQNLIAVVGPILALCLVSWPTGAAALAGYAVILAILVTFDAEMLRLVAAENAADRRYQSELVDCIGNVSTVLTLRLQEPTRRAVAERMEQVAKPLRRNVVVNETKWCAIDLLNNALRVGLVGVYAWLSWRDSGTVLIGTAVMINQYALQIGTVVGSMATHWQELVRNAADIGSADPILEAEPAAAGAALPQDWTAIALSGLRFRHGDGRGDRPGLDDVGLTLRRGQRIALVGESGSGKSTLLRVLAGLYRPEAIQVAVDGVTRLGVRDLSSAAMLVPQDPEIFEGSIRRNLTLGIDLPEEAIAHACRLARIDGLLASLPAGLDTEITERGLNLSGGQKQRLALARGILAARGAALIMLDEPTSSMDPVTELAIYDGLLAEFPQACVLSSVHRLHLLSRFDLVVLMAAGRVVDSGPLDEIMTRQPHLRAMWNSYMARQEPEMLAG